MFYKSKILDRRQDLRNSIYSQESFIENALNTQYKNGRLTIDLKFNENKQEAEVYVYPVSSKDDLNSYDLGKAFNKVKSILKSKGLDAGGLKVSNTFAVFYIV